LQDFDADAWDDELDGEGDPDTTWEADQDTGDEPVSSNENPTTLSSKVSKRSFDDFDLEYSDDDFVTESPGLFYTSSLAINFFESTQVLSVSESNDLRLPFPRLSLGCASIRWRISSFLLPQNA